MKQDLIQHVKSRPWHTAGVVLLFLFSPGKKLVLAKKYLTPMLVTFGIAVVKRAFFDQGGRQQQVNNPGRFMPEGS